MIEIWAEGGACDKNIKSALKYVRAVADAGAQALKVQWYQPETHLIPDALRYDQTEGPAKTQWEVIKNPIYPYERWVSVIDLARDQGIEFIPSVFDHESIDFAEQMGIKTIKIASGEITNFELISHAAEVAKRIALSTGGSTLDEVDEALSHIQGPEIVLMACHLEYPTPVERANIARTFDLQYNFPDETPGFSDHTAGILSIPLIVATGCQVIEKHFTLAKGHGYDSDFALDAIDLRNAVISAERTMTLMGDSTVTPDASEMRAREGARRSCYTARAIPTGKPLDPYDIVVLRPGTGLPPSAASTLEGMAPSKDLPKHHQLSWEDFGNLKG